jgi:hypothetical protein
MQVNVEEGCETKDLLSSKCYNKISSYLTGNTLRLPCKDKQVNSIYCENHTKQINTEDYLLGYNAV